MSSDPLQPDRCAELLNALAAPERLKIVRVLSIEPHTITDIAARLRVPVVNLSHHLKVLRTAGIVQKQKHGRFVVCSLRPGILEEVTEAGSPRTVINLGCCRLVLQAENPNRARV